MNQPSSSQYTPENPKLTLDMINKLGTSCNLALSYGIGRTNIQQEKIFMESSSSFQMKDFKHSIGDTYKLVEPMSFSLNTILRRKQDCKLSSVLNLAVYVIQCIKSRLNLMKTTLDPHSDRFQIVVLRSANIPTAWAQRTGMIRVFEILVCLHVSRKLFPRAFFTHLRY